MADYTNLIAKIDELYQRKSEAATFLQDKDATAALDESLALLNQGTIRIAEYHNGDWTINQWVQKSILLQLASRPSAIGNNSALPSFDKLPLKYQPFLEEDFKQAKIRVVPGALIRDGSFLAPGVVAMPCFVNIGAYVDQDTMIDTWATVGSGGQIGKKVHLSGGAGIGGVLEPLGASPTIIEDNCFIGARSEIVEGVVVGTGSVIAMGVFIGKSTKIYDRTTRTLLTGGTVPPHSVVVPGTLSSAKHSEEKDVCALGAAIIIKQVDAQTRSKTSINELLRG